MNNNFEYLLAKAILQWFVDTKLMTINEMKIALQGFEPTEQISS